MKAENWRREAPDATGHGIDCWVGESELGHRWLVTMWFGDEDSDGELPPDEFAIELCRFDSDSRAWTVVTYDKLDSRQQVLDTFEQMKTTCD